jgi:creatinine amidohydrolase
MKSLRIEELTWPEVGKAIEDGYKTVIVPVGSTEQHGPHLPTGTDAYGGDCYGLRTAEKLGNALVAPTIRFGVSHHHMGMTGTITVSTDTLIHLVMDVCLSLDAHGFENIVLMSCHGNNHGPVIAAAQEVAPEVQATIVALAYPNQPESKARKILREHGITPEEAGYHAGASETSFIMAYKPELVARDMLQRGYVGPYAEKYFYTVQELQRIAPLGIFGDPTKATKELGEKLIEATTDQYVEIIRHELSG